MLSLQDKELQWESFRDSPQLGRHTWITLQLFDINAHHLIETVRMYLTLANKIEDKKFMSLLDLTDTNDFFHLDLGMEPSLEDRLWSTNYSVF